MNPPRQKSALLAIVVIAVGVLLPFVLTGGFQLRLAMLGWIFAMLGMGFNLLYGFTGQISLGQQGLYAVGAYAFAMLITKLGWPILVAGPAAVVITAIVALVIGIPLLRLRTHYLAMATLGFGMIFAGVANRWIDFTGGTTGLEIPPVSFAGAELDRVQTYYVVLAIGAAVLLIHDFVIRGHIGRALQAIRDDERAAAALGVHVTRVKLRVFVLTAVMSALAGVAYTIASLRVDPSMSEFSVIVSILTMAVVGGLGTRFGPILGAIFIVVLPQFLQGIGDLQTLVYGLCILLFLLFLPHGLAGPLEVGKWLRKRAPLPASAAAEAAKSEGNRQA